MNTLKTSREIKASPEEVYAAMTTPERLAKWWGPDGFSNTFEICEMKEGGQWKFLMHGPDGKDYPNLCEFGELIPSKKFVVEHVVEPKFVATFTLSSSESGTLLVWESVFENEKFLAGMKDFLESANEQNIDRLIAEVETI